MNKFLDLRFVIGLFFLIIGTLLLIYHFLFTKSKDVENLYCGYLFVIFGSIFLIISNKSDEKN
jgi:hypothetical protein